MTSAPNEHTLKNWKKALNLARHLFEDSGYHSRFLDQLEAFLRASIGHGAFATPENQTALWHRLFDNPAPLAPSEVELHHVKLITERLDFVECVKSYGQPLPVDHGGGVVGSKAGLLFLDDDTGQIVAYAPPKRDPAETQQRRSPARRNDRRPAKRRAAS